jgi:hypothetical protein
MDHVSNPECPCGPFMWNEVWVHTDTEVPPGKAYLVPLPEGNDQDQAVLPDLP